jgi:chemotaxis protein MotB
MDEPTFLDDGDVEPVQRKRRGSATPWLLLVLALAGGAAASWFLWTRLDRALAERADLAQRLQAIEAEKADLLALRNELSVQVQAKEDELAKLQGTYQDLETRMKEEIEKGDVTLSQAGGRIKVDLVDRILFDVGDASVTERGAEVLSRVGAVLAAVEDKKIQVSGHTDDLPISERLADRFPTNWELAAARASNVVRFLEEKANVPGRRLVAAAYGPWEPISSNKSASGRARNRRIEIVLTPQLAPAPIDEGAQAAIAARAASAPAKAAVVPAKASAPAKAAAAPVRTAAKPSPAPRKKATTTARRR